MWCVGNGAKLWADRLGFAWVHKVHLYTVDYSSMVSYGWIPVSEESHLSKLNYTWKVYDDLLEF